MAPCKITMSLWRSLCRRIPRNPRHYKSQEDTPGDEVLKPEEETPGDEVVTPKQEPPEVAPKDETPEEETPEVAPEDETLEEETPEEDK